MFICQLQFLQAVILAEKFSVVDAFERGFEEHGTRDAVKQLKRICGTGVYAHAFGCIGEDRVSCDLAFLHCFDDAKLFRSADYRKRIARVITLFKNLQHI